MSDLIPATAADALERWDKGGTVFTVEMGGLGPGYEQCIQLLTFEIIRDHLEDVIPEKNDLNFQKFVDAFGEKAISRCDDTVGGFSSAQVGAARALAWRAIRDGWRAMVESVPIERHIQVSRSFPKAPPPAPPSVNRAFDLTE